MAAQKKVKAAETKARLKRNAAIIANTGPSCLCFLPRIYTKTIPDIAKNMEVCETKASGCHSAIDLKLSIVVTSKNTPVFQRLMGNGVTKVPKTLAIKQHMLIYEF